MKMNVKMLIVYAFKKKNIRLMFSNTYIIHINHETAEITILSRVMKVVEIILRPVRKLV